MVRKKIEGRVYRSGTKNRRETWTKKERKGALARKKKVVGTWVKGRKRRSQ